MFLDDCFCLYVHFVFADIFAACIAMFHNFNFCFACINKFHQFFGESKPMPGCPGCPPSFLPEDIRLLWITFFNPSVLGGLHELPLSLLMRAFSTVTASANDPHLSESSSHLF